MSKRPQISDDLHDYVQRLHREYTGTSPGSFEEALQTVTQLAEAGIEAGDGLEDEWYPGKYIGMIVENVFDDSRTGRPNTGRATRSRGEAGRSVLPEVDLPEQTAVFKSYLHEEHTLTMPDAEAAALNASEEDLLQVIAYQIDQ
jgi:hypothetical protein